MSSLPIDKIFEPTIINQAMREDFREKVVREALVYRKKGSSRENDQLTKIIRTKIVVDGFRHGKAHEAQISKLLRPMITGFQEHNEAVLAVLRVWVVAHTDLHDSLSKYLVDIGIEVEDEADLDKGFRGYLPTSEAREIASSYSTKYPQFDLDDVTLMTCCLTSQVLIPDDAIELLLQELAVTNEDQEESEVERLTEESYLTGEAKLDEWIEFLKAMPSDLAIWDKLDLFITSIQGIAHAKRLEKETLRETQRLEEEIKNKKFSLGKLITDLFQETQDEYDYLEMEEVKNWSVEKVKPEELDSAAEKLARLFKLLLQHRELRLQPTQTRAEDRQRRHKVDELADTIDTIYHQLCLTFGVCNDVPDEELIVDKKAEDNEAEALEDGSSLPVSEVEQETPTSVEYEETALTPEVEVPDEVITSDTDQLIQKEVDQPETLTKSEPKALEEKLPLHEDSKTEQIVVEIEESVGLESETEPPTHEDEEQNNVDEIAPGLEVTVQAHRSVQETAQALKENETAENRQALLWAMLAEGDIVGAYWLAISFESSDIDSPVPSWFLKILQGSRWLEANSDLYTSELLQLVSEHQMPSDPALQLLGLSSALNPTLISPYSGLIGLLNTEASIPTLHSISTAIREFAGLNIALSKDDVHGVAGAAERKNLIVEASTAAKRFLDTAPNRRTKLLRASDVWRYMISRPDGEIKRALLIAAEDRRTDLHVVKEFLDLWEQYDFIVKQIDETDQKLHQISTRKIVGNPRDQLIRYIEEALGLIRKWYRLVENEQKIETRGNWFFEQIALLRQEVQDSLPNVYAYIASSIDQSQPLKSYAVGMCLLQTLHQLATTLDIKPSLLSQQIIGSTSWDWLKVNATTLTEAFAKRLLFVPDIQLSDDGQPIPDYLSPIGKLLLDSLVAKHFVSDIVNLWLQKQDYRFINQLLASFLESDELATAKQRYAECNADSRTYLQEQKGITESAIEEAVIDGVIADERTEYLAIVEAIVPENVLNFPPKYDDLTKIRSSLANARHNRIDHLKALWEELKSKLKNSVISEEKQLAISAFVTELLERQDTRVAEEYLSRLDEDIESGSDISDEWLQPKVERDPLVEYMLAAPEIEKWLGSERSLQNIVEDLLQGVTRAGIRFGNVPPKRREDAIKAIQAWRELKKQGSHGLNNVNAIATILFYLGLTFNPGISKVVEIDRIDRDWGHYRVFMSAGENAKPIPQFGSQANGTYHVICLWERPGMDAIAARLMELRLRLKTVLVLYLGRITTKQRYELIKVSKDQDLVLPVLDETLLLSLSQEREIRLPNFLRCALPFTTLNPYTPFQAGDVPPEIFYGRSSLVSELQSQKGSCLVYGGRQLGKSALLRHVQREFDHRPHDQYAQVVDIKLIGDPLAWQTTDKIWKKLRDCFQEFGLLSLKISTEKPEELEKYIREAFSQRREIRVLILFDEADKFLNADAKDNFRVTERLRTLMVDTERRFKVVFAGLHNVQRFQGIPNQPFAHFGTPICVGPLEPEAARRLIREPFEYLGYRFSDDSGILRILSYTNYHPGLIQLFCEELLIRLRKSSGNGLPPYRIVQSDIEAVYRQVRERIKERFDWTLELDTRYQAVAWSLVVDQLETKDSFARGYPPGEILRLVREWWPQGFKGVDIAEMRGRLDEMVGLGVLIRDPQGLYRLRSPNLVRLMGTESDIETQLLELMEKQPEVTFEADHHHTPLDEKAQVYSPLTYAQERSLNKAKTGVGLIFVSEALGASSLIRAFQKFVPSEGVLNGNCEDIPIYIGGADIQNWLDRHIRIHGDNDHIVVYQYVPKRKPGEIHELIEGAIEFSGRRQSHKRILRVLFVFDPEVGWDWFSLPTDHRKSLEDRADATITLKRWNEVGIRQRLAQQDKVHWETIVKTILEATGGWPCLLEKLFEWCGPKDDPREIAEKIKNELYQPGSNLHKLFRQSLGIEHSAHAAKTLLSYFLQEDKIPLDYVTPDLTGVDIGLSAEQYPEVVEYLRRLSLIEVVDDIVAVNPIVKKVLKFNE